MTHTRDTVERTKAAQPSRKETVYAAKRTLTEFTRAGGTDLAAQLTYFIVLAIAPTLLALFSLAALVLADFQDEISAMIKDAISQSNMGEGADGFQSAVDSTLDTLIGSTSGGTIALIIGILTALWSASAFVKAFSRVSNQIYKIKESRGAIQFNGSMFLVTTVLIIGLLIIMLSFMLSEGIVSGVLGPLFKAVGLQGLLQFLTGTFLPIWVWIKWPVIIVLLFAVVSLLYWAAPNLKRPYRFISPGGVFAVIGIAVALAALSIYMSTLAGYSSYGAIGSVMAVLFALWVINIVVILGATFDAEMLRAQQLAIGEPAEETFELPARGTPGKTKADQKYEKVIDEGRHIRVNNLHKNQERYGSTFAGNERETHTPPVDEEKQ